MFFVVSGSVRLHRGALPDTFADGGGAALLPPAVPAGRTAAANEEDEDEDDLEGRERGPGEVFGELVLFPGPLGRRRKETAVAQCWGMAHVLPVICGARV